jgi:hypothetical protein
MKIAIPPPSYTTSIAMDAIKLNTLYFRFPRLKMSFKFGQLHAQDLENGSEVETMLLLGIFDL